MIVRTISVLVTALCLAMGGSVSANAQPATAEASGAPPVASGVADTGSSAYVLGRDDVVQIGLLGRTDFGGRARVQADGTVQLQFVGKIPAAERTTAELAENVRKALQAGGYFSDPVVTIEVVGYASRYVTVLGAVGSPGLVPINRPYRLSEIMARVGGARDTGADYIMVRPERGEEKRYLIRDLATGDLSQDPYVAAGDKIYVPAAETFYIYGQVNSPGQFPMASGMTLRMAIARAGGLGESGSDKKADITRAGKKVKIGLDEVIQPGDVIVIGERLF
ncbi:MAG: SLBB domain-containing protein [Phenylobacterium sp.]|uniref:polysaccharide biosynthesis/export family protein n=1 Tax=Phenylobacterium sp. TaxID=1871053 RepID=UPI001A4A36A5|nr:SLBB domain-containing protein [Phenylobacterium sp.]MBL8554518.1 SLBB domain-containing protein [Phenylobacterium sp.]